ncbi:hypothetical protein GCM10010082_08590 [Kushneria pakistanensis]|uniref:DUF1285 domain-containing protein n=1 Tax=Kushneria pakistanensis TaxID=1508770 RepID=A0ABQ3FD53_9GAMM|nr:DUF1285 domain-containing protein [Kushneria pakistanensis]GHC19303.1 hypothetical protein GCM10010082_08590 [Kushneria pakistanensis]
MSLERLLTVQMDDQPLPLECWHPALSGDLDILADRHGSWWHEGTRVEHPRVLRALSRLLRREADGHYYLVTPVEKWRIRVEDYPLIIVDAHRHETTGEDACWVLTTQTGEHATLNDDCHLVVDENTDIPLVNLRHGLSARLSRQCWYHLVEQAECVEDDKGRFCMGLYSGGHWHALGAAMDSDDIVTPPS